MAVITPRPLPVLDPAQPRGGDLTRLPVLGRFLRWKHARTAMQIPLFLLAAVIVLDGLFGPQVAPQNAAGVAPWVQWRGLVVLALLIAGNLFCMACPFMLPRRLAKRLLPADRSWPAGLRGKWIALALLVLFFWAYEAFDLWSSPWLTAWIVLAYFAAAFVIDGFFKGAAFCKYACPIGSFNFINSLASPAEVAVRDPSVCAACETKDCIAGRYDPEPVLDLSAAGGAAAIAVRSQPGGGAASSGAAAAGGARRRLVQSGCELWLYQPRKVGNLDCTFCLDCVQACPHDNVGILARVPGGELVRDRWRSGIGRLGDRPDLFALAMVVVFAAFLNAAGMIGPMGQLQSAIGAALGITAEPLVWGVVLVGGLIILPLLLLAVTAVGSRALAGADLTSRDVLLRMGWGLVPLGFGMWLGHYAFHFLAGGLSLLPVLHRGAVDIGWAMGSPDWSFGALVPADWLLPLEILLVEAGLLGSLVLCHYIARSTFGSMRRARRGFAPWALLAIALGGLGAWILMQPMEMRGMMMPGMQAPEAAMESMMPGMDEGEMEMTRPAGRDMTPGQGAGSAGAPVGGAAHDG